MIQTGIKQTFALAAALLISMTLFAQKNSSDARYRQYAGRYGGNSGVCLFEDGHFMMYGYATAVFGSYVFEKDYLLFYPDRQELFQVYAHRNTSIGDSVRIQFAGFERGSTYVQFDKGSIRQVFNEDANCFDAPYVYQAANGAPAIITLSNKFRENGWYLGQPDNSWRFPIAKGFNDLILVYNEPRREYEDFSAMLVTTKEGAVLKLSNYGGDGGYGKQTPDEGEQKQWQEVLVWKNQYDEAKAAGEDTVYANKHYRMFPPPDELNYTFDAASNLYISKHAAENEDYFRQDQYQDDRYLKKYVRLQPDSKDSVRFAAGEVATGSIFFTTCGEGAERSYHYNGYQVYPDPEEQTAAPVTTAPAPVPEPAHKIADDYRPGTAQEDAAASYDFRPFKADRPDGFYLVVKANEKDRRKTVLASKPALSKKDIASANVVADGQEAPAVRITFTETGKAKLRKFSSDNAGKLVAIVVGKKVVMMPLIREPIAGGEVTIAGGFTPAEAQHISNLLSGKE